MGAIVALGDRPRRGPFTPRERPETEALGDVRG